MRPTCLPIITIGLASESWARHSSSPSPTYKFLALTKIWSLYRLRVDRFESDTVHRNLNIFISNIEGYCVYNGGKDGGINSTKDKSW